MRTAHRNGKLKAALGLLNEAVEDRYSALKESIADQAVHGKEIVTKGKEQLMKTLHQKEAAMIKKAEDFNRKVRRNPWPFMGAAALGAFIMGLSLSRKRRKAAPAGKTVDAVREEEEIINE